VKTFLTSDPRERAEMYREEVAWAERRLRDAEDELLAAREKLQRMRAAHASALRAIASEERGAPIVIWVLT